MANAPARSETVDARGLGSASGSVTFSDDPPSITGNDATITIDTPRYVHVLRDGGGNAATVTVLDQYGDPFRGARVSLSSNLDDVFPGGGRVFAVGRSGSQRFTYDYSGPGGVIETLSVFHGVDSLSSSGATARVYWAADAAPNDDDLPRTVLTGDIRRKHIVVADTGVTPVLLEYDGNDRFNVAGDPVSLAFFESVLAAELKFENPDAELEWSSYRAGSSRSVAEYNLIP